MAAQTKHREVVLASAARTADPSSVDIDTRNYAGVIIYIDVTAIVTTPSITVNVDGYDSYADEQYTLLDSAALSAVGFTVLKIWPGATAAANAAANEYLPDRIRIDVAHADADSITYSITAVFLP